MLSNQDVFLVDKMFCLWNSGFYCKCNLCIISILSHRLRQLSVQVAEMRSCQAESRGEVEAMWKTLGSLAGKKLQQPQVLSLPRIRKTPTKREEKEELKSPGVIHL